MPSSNVRVILAIALAASAAMGCARRGGSTPPTPEQMPEAEGASGRSMQGEGTGSVSVVDGADLQGQPNAQVEEMLAGRVPGVQVMRLPGGGISVRIRGVGSWMSDSEPLYVVDGMPVTVSGGRGLYWLNPGDLQRIEILKDASATSFYGVRGANGVVIVTTKRGARKAAKPNPD